MLILETERLRLRTWKDEDLFFLIKMNQDPRVMEYFPSLIGPKETELFVKKIEEHFKRKGYSLYAVERKDQGAFIGFIGFLLGPVLLGYISHTFSLKLSFLFLLSLTVIVFLALLMKFKQKIIRT